MVVMLLPVIPIGFMQIFGKLVIFQLWTSSSAISFRSDSYHKSKIIVVSPLNARDQVDPRK